MQAAVAWLPEIARREGLRVGWIGGRWDLVQSVAGCRRRVTRTMLRRIYDRHVRVWHSDAHKYIPMPARIAAMVLGLEHMTDLPREVQS